MLNPLGLATHLDKSIKLVGTILQGKDGTWYMSNSLDVRPKLTGSDHSHKHLFKIFANTNSTQEIIGLFHKVPRKLPH